MLNATTAYKQDKVNEMRLAEECFLLKLLLHVIVLSALTREQLLQLFSVSVQSTSSVA